MIVLLAWVVTGVMFGHGLQRSGLSVEWSVVWAACEMAMCWISFWVGLTVRLFGPTARPVFPSDER